MQSPASSSSRSQVSSSTNSSRSYEGPYHSMPSQASDSTNAPRSNAGPYHMTEEILKQRAETPNGGRYLTQLFAGIVASVASISFGTVVGWSSPALRAATEESEITDTLMDSTDVDIALVGCLAPFGCAVGVIVWSYFNVKIGPRKTMVIQSPLLFITWILIALVKRLNVALAGRFFCGFLAISYRVCGETLLLDSVHTLRLRYMVISYRACMYLGVLLAYVCGYYITDHYFSILNCIIVGAHFVLLLICPESPVYLYDVNIKKAEAALSWYRGKENIYVEMRNIKKDSEVRKMDQLANKYMFRSKVVYKAMLIIVGVNFSQAVSGYYIFLYYNPAMIRQLSDVHVGKIVSAELDSKIDAITRNVDAVLLASNMFLSALVSTYVHYNVMFGVKKPLVFSCTCVSLVLTVFAAYYYLREFKVAYILKHNWIYMVLVHLLVMSFEVGMSCCGDIMLMDYIPSQIYPRAKMITRCLQWIFIGVITRCYFQITNLLKGGATMSLFACLQLVCLVLACRYVVESKGKSLIKIQTEIGGNPIGTRGTANRRFGHHNEAMLT